MFLLQEEGLGKRLAALQMDGKETCTRIRMIIETIWDCLKVLSLDGPEELADYPSCDSDGSRRLTLGYTDW
jgi:hypothetical protein